MRDTEAGDVNASTKHYSPVLRILKKKKKKVTETN